jgi:hypothetical protein
MARHWLTALGGILTVLPALIAAAIPGGILFLILAPVPLFLVGLGQGVRACWIAGMIALIVAGLVGGLPWMTTALVLLVAPVCVLVQQALRSRPGQDGTAEWYPPGLLVAWLTVLGVIWLALMIGLLAAEHGGLGAQDALVEELKPHLGQMLPDAEEAQIDQVLAIAINWAPGFSTVAWLVIMLALNGVLAEGLLLRFGKAIRPAPDIATLSLPVWPAWALTAALLLAVFGSGGPAYLARNLALVLMVPYFFAGLAVVHGFCRRFAAGGFILAVFYAALFVWAVVLPLGLAILGMIDQWAGIRRRMQAGPPNEEEE